MWRLYTALENSEIDEKESYSVIEIADVEYYKLNEKIRELMEAYFVRIHTELIEVVNEQDMNKWRQQLMELRDYIDG